MRTGCLLLLGLGGGAISLSTPGCGGKLTNAETRDNDADAAITAGGTTTGSGGTDNTGAGGSGATGGGTGGTADPDPGGLGGSGTGTGATGGTGGSGTGATGGTGGSGPGDPGGTGGSGGGGDPPRIDASPGCPMAQPANGSPCTEVSTMCSYGTTICACMNSGGGGGRGRDGGMTTWTCGGGTMDAGRGGRG